jgi:phytanoyl-CoA dioxygenase PhyH
VSEGAGAAIDAATFDRDGYVLLSGAVPEALCADLVAVIDGHIGVEADRASWYDRPRPFLDCVALWGHPAQWEIRQHPPLHAAWAALWGQEELLVSLDRCRFTPPWREGEPDPLPMHWDHNPHTASLHYLQGVVALTATDVGQGGFRCAPGWHRREDRWPTSAVSTPAGEEWHAPVSEEDIVTVPMEAGDVVVWSSRLPHSNSRNTSSVPRYAFYVQMFPYDESEAAESAACWRSGRCHRAWSNLPGHDHVEAWAPVPLSPLGRRLAGLEPWSSGVPEPS